LPEGVLGAAILVLGATAAAAGGFGFALITLTLYSFFFSVKPAVAFLVIHSLAHNVLQVIPLYPRLRKQHLVPLLTGAVLGVPAGVLFLKAADPVFVQRLLGAVVLLFVAQSLRPGHGCQPQAQRRGATRLPVAYGVGACSGALMGAFLSGGPPLVMYAARIPEDKCHKKALLQAFFFLSNCYALILYGAAGLLSKHLLISSLAYLPATVAGTLLGTAIFNRLSSETFNRGLQALLAVLGLALLAK